MSRGILSSWVSFALSSVLFVGAAQKEDRKLGMLGKDGRGVDAVHYQKRRGRKGKLKSDWSLGNLVMKYPVASAAGSFSLGCVVGAVGNFAFGSFCKGYNKHNSAGECRSPKKLIDNWRESIGENPDSFSTIGTWLRGVACLDVVSGEFAKRSKEELKKLKEPPALIDLKSRGKVGGKVRQFDKCARICFDDHNWPECFSGGERLNLSYGERILLRSVFVFFYEKFGVGPCMVERSDVAYFNFAFFVDDNVSYGEIDEAVVDGSNGTFEQVVSTHVPTFVNNFTCNFRLYRRR